MISLFVFPSQYCSNGGGDDETRPCISFEVTFSEPMDRASVEGALTIEPSGKFNWTNGDAYGFEVPGV